jgi:outer membrane protein insertion porin family
VALGAALATGVRAQGLNQTTVIDSITVSGNRRVGRETILATANLPLGQPVSFRDVQRAMDALYSTNQFDSIQVYQGTVGGREVLRFEVYERPLLSNWTLQGTVAVPERKVRGRIRLIPGLPYDPAAAARSRASIDSLYADEGYHGTTVSIRPVTLEDGTLQVIFDVDEGRRVTVSRVVIEGNEQFTDAQVVSNMGTRPEGFWWFRTGELDEERLERDIRERLPLFYASRGFIDFHVVEDSLIVDETTGKATLQLNVSEGQQYRVGSFDVVGNRQFSGEQIRQFYPFRSSGTGGFLGLGGGNRDELPLFDAAKWEAATQQVQTLYMNSGYIYAQVQGTVDRRTAEDGTNLVDLRWQVVERQPAVVNRVLIRGNTVTHEDVIRRAILMVPGDVMRQSALISSYQNISNLGFFEQPLPIPTTEPANQQGDVDVTFHVKERHTGNINFGATVGQGTGLGGFIGLTEPNLFGRGKRVQVQWQFGSNINDLNVSYTDPALRGSLISGMVSAHNSRLRYTVADLGRIHTRGVSLEVGFPLMGSRFTRLLGRYTLEQNNYDSPGLRSVFFCDNCVLSSVSLSLVRDTRVGLPFPTGGLMHRFTLAQGGGVLGGSGDFRRATFEGRWYTPLAQLGGQDVFGGGMTVVFGLGTQAGWVWGDPGPHFRQLFSMGGTQYGIPLRGYDEFSITPLGYDPSASGNRASSVGAFGRSYFAGTAEIGLRVSQAIYLSSFFEAGNLWERPGQFNPSRLFRGAGVGVSLVTPLGPIGIDYAYGFDKVDLLGNPDPSFKFHFRLGNFF